MFTTMLLAACFLSGDPTPPANEELKLDVRRAVRKLDADQLAEREAAEQSLLDKGPAALDYLPEIDDKTSPEVRVRLTRVRQKLQQALAEAAVKPSLITLKDDALPLSKALAALAEQSGNKIEDRRERFGQPAGDPAIKADFEKTPFWQALDQVLDRAGLTLYPFAEGAGLNVVAKGEKQMPLGQTASYAGPFRFLPTQAATTRELRTDAASSLRISVETAWEPRLKPIALKQKLADIEAVDDKGNRLQIDAEGDLEVPVDSGRAAVELVLPFAAPPREAKEIASIKGKLSAIVPGKVETFRFEDLLKAKNAQKRIAGATVTLEGVRQNNEAWEVRIRVKFDEAGDALASHRGWIFQNEAYMEDADGKPIAFDAYETTRQAKDEVGLAYIFALEKPPEKLKFIYKTPAALFAPTFEYELKSIKLP
ncbi:MAG: hypothetical protein IT426_02505 [Pirellulales bacterium]|nr:hypothetical protein [Pirellulales bacterium]